MSALIPAAAYYRMSDPRQDGSIDRQRAQVEPYARSNGYAIVREYADEGIAGSEIARRKQFQRMLRDAQAGAFQVILCDDADRFGRFDSIDLGEVVAPLRRKGIVLVTVTHGRTDWNSFAGRITAAVLQEAKDQEQRAISYRVLTGQIEKARAGRTTGGKACYGYRWEGERLVPDGHKAEVVRLIFRLYDEGRTLMAVAEELFRRGVPSPKGAKCWTRSVLHRLMKNRRYVGDWTWGVHPQGKRLSYRGKEPAETARHERRKRWNPEEAWVVIPDRHEALVERDLFERVQARLVENQAATTPHKNGGDFVLSRLLVCSHCGSFLVGTTARGRRLYVCRGYLAYGKNYCQHNAVYEAPLVNFLLRKLQQTYLDPDHLQKLRQEVSALEAAERSDDNLARLRRQLGELEAKIAQGNERLVILPVDRVPGVVEQIRRWEKERDDLARELKRVESSSRAAELERAVADAEAMLWRLQEAVESEDRPLLRQVLREMVARVEFRWDHWQEDGRTRSRLSGGVVWLQAGEDSAELSPSAAR